ncbi:MAG: hypothetical protein JW873_07615 [Candidatus Saganbacteria bacterium]|nr:hypothetical protein [Candidatus Saganbacteria bacterium]
MKKITALLCLSLMLAGMAAALELTDRVGFGLRANYFTLRRYVSNNFGFEVIGGYSKTTREGQPDSDESNYGFGLFYCNEVHPGTLLQAGAAVQGWQGKDSGTAYTGLALNPFIGAEHFVTDHFAADFKVFPAAYSSQLYGGVRTTTVSLLSGSLGMHVYF